MNNILAIAPGTPRTTDDPEYMNFLQQQHPTSRSLLVHITGSEVAGGGGESEAAPGADVPAASTVVAGENPSGEVQNLSVDAAGRVNVNIPTAAADLTTLVPTQITKTVAATATPEAIAADGTFFRHATIIAKKAARTLNVGIVYIGATSPNDAQAFDLEPGDVWTIDAPLGTKLDLNDFYVDVLNAGDGVIVIYW